MDLFSISIDNSVLRDAPVQAALIKLARALDVHSSDLRCASALHGDDPCTTAYGTHNMSVKITSHLKRINSSL